MESVFLNGGFIGATLDFASEERYTAGVSYDSTITGSSGGSPDFRWKFNNSTAEEGSHSTTVNGSWSYATGLIPSIADASADLDGSTTYLVPANSALINDGTGYSWTKRSISFWFNADTTGSGTYPCIWEEGGGVNWLTIYFDNGLIYANIGEDSSTKGHATASVSTGTTYHCLVTVDLTLGSNNIKIYLNGSLEGQATTSAGGDLNAHNGDVRIGSGAARNHLNSNITYATYNGRLQDLCYWFEEALTSTDASNIYTAGVTAGNLKNSGIWLLQSVYDSLYVPSIPEIVALYAESSASGTSITVTLDGDAVEGDMIVCSWSTDQGPTTIDSVPSGFTELDRVDNNSNYTHGLWYKTLTSGDISAGSFTWTLSAGGTNGRMLVLIARNVSNIAYGTSQDTSLSATSVNLASITTDNGGIWFAKAWADDDLGSISSYPSGFADNRTSIQVGSADSGGTLGYATSTTFPSGTQTFTFSGVSGEPLHTYWVNVY